MEILNSARFNNIPVAGFVAERLTNAPAVLPGRIVYNNTTNRMQYSTDSAFVYMVESLNGAGAVSVDATNPWSPTVSVADATSGSSGLLTAAGFTLLNGATPADTASTLVLRDASGSISVAAPTASSHAVNKAYVDTLNASGMRIIGGIDASTNPDYPAASVGDAYKVTVAGRIGGASGEVVQVNDVILATATSVGGDEATVGGDFIVLQGNIDLASDTVAGAVRYATAAEATSPTGVTDAVLTADQVSTLVGDGLILVLDSILAREYSEVIASGGQNWTVNHALGEETNVEVINAVTKETVSTDVSRPDLNNVLIHTDIVAPFNMIVMVRAAGATPTNAATVPTS